jgi:FMN-dependent oxidoreductase (nitrilotriacetate monooxygenase family)
MAKRMMHLVAYAKTGPTVAYTAGWRHPEATADDIFEPARYERLAQVLEQAKFDGVFFADGFGLADMYKGGFETYVRSGGQNSYLDPMSVLPIMARVTTHLGLGATISTSFHNAFHLARSLGSVDVLSKGRVAWNVVTSTTTMEARNAGMLEMPPHDERYDRADEVLEACFALWSSWDEDPFVLDKEAGIFADPSKVHYANYEGRWTRTRGPLPTPRSLQGRPVIMQAGSSDRGRSFAARWAELVFTLGQNREAMMAFYTDLKQRVAAEGRDPNSCKILPGITPIIGETESIARERAEYMESLQDKEYDMAYGSTSVGADLDKYKTAEEILAARGNQGIHGVTTYLAGQAEKNKVTLADTAGRRRIDNTVVGTPTMVADYLQDLFETGHCDGFVFRPTSSLSSYEQFCRSVVPELQRRSLFRTEYQANTLRGNLMG